MLRNAHSGFIIDSQACIQDTLGYQDHLVRACFRQNMPSRLGHQKRQEYMSYLPDGTMSSSLSHNTNPCSAVVALRSCIQCGVFQCYNPDWATVLAHAVTSTNVGSSYGTIPIADLITF
jgi:hypothetical protein